LSGRRRSAGGSYSRLLSHLSKGGGGQLEAVVERLYSHFSKGRRRSAGGKCRSCIANTVRKEEISWRRLRRLYYKEEANWRQGTGYRGWIAIAVWGRGTEVIKTTELEIKSA
jgi:hypothetical protein